MKIGGSLILHAADLHRRGVGAEEDVARAGGHGQRLTVGADEGRIGAERRRIDVEGVLEHPRRVAGRIVEGREVVVVVLDLGTLRDPVAEADEDVLDLAPRPRQRMEVAEPDRRRARQRHVDPLRGEAVVELGPLVTLAGLLEQRLELGADLVAGLADRPALLGRQLPDAAQDRRQLGLPAEEADPGLLDRSRVARRRDRRAGLVPYPIDPFQHHSSAPVAASDDIRCRPIAAAAATFSDSAPS